jgi:hypothetical protein
VRAGKAVCGVRERPGASAAHADGSASGGAAVPTVARDLTTRSDTDAYDSVGGEEVQCPRGVRAEWPRPGRRKEACVDNKERYVPMC